MWIHFLEVLLVFKIPATTTELFAKYHNNSSAEKKRGALTAKIDRAKLFTSELGFLE
jgi:hypothetical protein